MLPITLRQLFGANIVALGSCLDRAAAKDWVFSSSLEKSFPAHISYRIPITIRIRADGIVFLAQRVHPVPPCGDRVVLPGPIVVGVQPVRNL